MGPPTRTQSPILSHKTREEFDAWLLQKVQYYTVVYFQGRGKYYKYKTTDFKDAEQHAFGLARPCMLYGVCGEKGGYKHTVHIRNYNTKDTMDGP